MPERWLYRPRYPLDLADTLSCGQTFCWTQQADGWHGFIHGTPTHLQPTSEGIWVKGASPSQIFAYFHEQVDWESMYQSLPADPFLAEARAAHPGLRLIHEDWWECTANFICSPLKPISQIARLHQKLRRLIPRSSPEHSHHFPSPLEVSSVGEPFLRQCGLGYRARHLHRASTFLAQSPRFWDILERLDTPEATRHLLQLPGVGPKVAHCILLYAGARWDAFPVDVWVARLIQKLYFSRRHHPLSLREIESFSLQHFGPRRGLAQLLLFHWFRHRPPMGEPSVSSSPKVLRTP